MKGKIPKILSVALALVLVLSFSLVAAVPVSAATLTGVSATPANATETLTTTYTIGFTTATTCDVKMVDMEFDTGFNVSGATLSGTATGIGAGTVGKAGEVVTYTVTDPVVIPAGTAITIALSGIVNPTGAGTYSVTVTTKSIAEAAIDTGSADVTITPKPASFKVVAGTNNTVTAGEAFSVKITALKADGETTETGYAGDYFIDFVQVGGTPGTIPEFELISFTNGVGTSPANFILTVAGEAPQIKADASEPTVTGTSEVITINPAPLASFEITGEPGTVEAGAAFSAITVTALDAKDNTVTDYTGTVSWTSSDPLAELPADYTFTAGDAGSHEFPASDFTLKTVLLDEAGSPIDTTITVTDETAGVSKESTGIIVTPAAAASLTVTAEPTSIRADNINPSTITATAYDQFGNIATVYDGTEYTVTFSTSLGTMKSGAVDPTLGVATDTLTSDEVGVATIKVVDTDQKALPYATTTVSLVAPTLRTEVWVAPPPTGNDTNSGTEALPFETIPAAIDAVAAGGTVTVAGGTYHPAGRYPITVNKALTLQAAAGSSPVIVPVRDGGNAFQHGVIGIWADDVTIDGFNLQNDADGFVSGDVGIAAIGCKNFVIQNNTVTGFGDTDANYENCRGINTRGTHIDYNGLIKDNTLEANHTGIEISGSKGVTIQGNLLQSNRYGITLWSGSSDISVMENKVYSNTEEGIYVSSDCSGTFHSNDIDGNTPGFTYDGTVTMDAENNWWGEPSGPEHVSNPLGEGDVVSDFVDFTPWLDAPYAEPVEPVTTYAITLTEGYNLISLPLIPKYPAIETMLTDLNVAAVTHYTGGPAGTWPAYFSPDNPANTLDQMNDGLGYWMDMNAAGELVFEGWELVAETDPPSVPPSYDVVEGWNLIGFKSTTASSIVAYLGSVSETLDAIYGYKDGAFFIPTQLEPSLGYWIAVTGPGTIYP